MGAVRVAAGPARSRPIIDPSLTSSVGISLKELGGGSGVEMLYQHTPL